MRRLIPLLLAIILLSGCGGQSRQMQTVMEFRTRLQENGGCAFDATAAAQYTNYTSEFKLQCRYDTETKQLRFSVLEPELIEQISGVVGQDRRTVTFDTVAMELELLADERIAPLALPQILAQSWDSGYIVSAGTDRDYTVAVFQNGYEDDTLKIETWFENGVPVYADVWYQGRCQAGVDIESFYFQK